MEPQELIPHLFRTEYSKVVAVLCKLFGVGNIALAEDIASDTFLQAAETWGLKGLPPSPVGWLYTVARNKATDYLRRNTLFHSKIAPSIRRSETDRTELTVDLSGQNITDSQLQMMFAVCHPCISPEAQVGLALNILCGFGAEEIADAFLSNKETIYKRLGRAKEKLKTEKIELRLPPAPEIKARMEPVLTTLYLLFSEGYYSLSQNTTLRKELCVEAMRLTLMLAENPATALPKVHALLSLMCFHSSRFDARSDENGEMILYEDQDATLWNQELIARGEYYLNKAATGQEVSKYHLEAAIAYWHTHKADTREKWEQILQLYNRLLITEYTPSAALNRTYALSKANSPEEALTEAEKLNLTGNHFYHSLLATLYTGIDDAKALAQWNIALSLAKTPAEKKLIYQKVEALLEGKVSQFKST